MNEIQPKTTQWFYDKNGERKGPISEEDMIPLIRESVITHGTSVWKQGFTDWLNIENTDLRIHLDTTEPPPLLGNQINNSIVWVLAFAPLIGYFAEWFIAGAIHKDEYLTQAAMDESKYWFVTLVLNVLLSVSDERLLAKAGHNTKTIKFWAWFLVPVYLYKRAKATKQNLAYFIVWIFSFVLVLFS